MRELTTTELDAVSGGEIKQVGVCTNDDHGKAIKIIVVAVANYLRDIWK